MCGTKPIDEKAENMGWYDLIKTVHHAFEYGLYNDINHKDVEQEISSAMDKFAKQNDLPVHDWKTPYEDQYGTQEETPMIELFGWNDVSNTKIPLDVEIFALLEDRMDPEKLRPEVIVARMSPAKKLTWTKNKEGDVLCYDVPAGNFHSCNGAQIKYWKAVDFPKKLNSCVCGVVAAPKDCFDAEPAPQQQPQPKSNPVAPEGYWRLITHCFAPDEYEVQWKCECGTVNKFKKSVPDLCKFPVFSVYCSHCNKKLNVTFDLDKMTN